MSARDCARHRCKRDGMADNGECLDCDELGRMRLDIARIQRTLLDVTARNPSLAQRGGKPAKDLIARIRAELAAIDRLTR